MTVLPKGSSNVLSKPFEACKDIFSAPSIMAILYDLKKDFVGRWESKEDSKSVIVFNENGGFESIYDGKSIDSGNWFVDGYKLINITNEEEFTYTIIFVGIERLELSYLPNGNTLSFSRIEE